MVCLRIANSVIFKTLQHLLGRDSAHKLNALPPFSQQTPKRRGASQEHLMHSLDNEIEVRDSRTGYFNPARYGLEVWPGSSIWSLSLWNWALVEALDALRPGFCREFRYLSYGQSGLAWGAISEKCPNIRKMNVFKNMHVPKIQNC